jgi:hypothetical protein
MAMAHDRLVIANRSCMAHGHGRCTPMVWWTKTVWAPCRTGSTEGAGETRLFYLSGSMQVDTRRMEPNGWQVLGG